MSQKNSDHTNAEPLSLEPKEKPVAIEPEPREEPDEEPLSLVDPEESKIKQQTVRTFGAGTSPLGEKKEEFKRPLNLTGKGATRCRVFHSRIALSPLEHLQDSINEWLDADEIEVKHVGHIIGTMEEKRKEPNMIVMVWY